METSIGLFEVTVRADNSILAGLSCIPTMWNNIKQFSTNQDWWYLRTQHLTSKNLTYRIGNWSNVYASLEKNGLEFDTIQDYNNPLLIQVLFEIGADPTVHSWMIIESACYDENLEVFRLLLSDPRVDPSVNDNYAIQYMCSEGNAEIVKLLLADPRVDPSSDSNVCLRSAVGEENLDVVLLLLSDSRIDPSDNNNEALIDAVSTGEVNITRALLADRRVNPAAEDNTPIKIACEYGFIEIVQLLLATQLVNHRVDDCYCLKQAVAHNHIPVIRLLIQMPAPGNLTTIFLHAVKFSKLETVELLLSDGRLDPRGWKNKPLKLARKYGRRDVERLLLTYTEVREVDEKARC